MGPKKALLSRDEFEKERAAEDRKINAENDVFIQNVEARVAFQQKKLLEFGEGGLTYPIDMKNRLSELILTTFLTPTSTLLSSLLVFPLSSQIQ